jgi:internalin A
LIVVFICSCAARGRTAPPVENRGGGIISNSENTAGFEVEAKETAETEGRYTFRYSENSNTYYGLNDLSYFLAAPSIKSIRLAGGTFSDLSPLVMLKDLEELEIMANGFITDISPIGALANLKKLTIINVYNIKSIEPLSSLANLQYLSLDYKDKYFRELAPLQRLEALRLSTRFEDIDTAYIAQIRSLKELALDIGETTNAKPLGKLTNLESLSLNISLVANALDISWIAALRKLKKLSIRFGTVEDVSPLAELPNLTEIDFHGTTIKDITPLLKSKTLKKVTEFYLENIDQNELFALYSQFEERGIECRVFDSYH